jgi:CDP-diacylglycerol---serine O-phosphatidyltransferase
MKLLRHLPNALTCGNLFCGCIGILFAVQYSPVTAAYFVWAACVFDFFDGFATRALHYSSPIGKELDSLADMVSFGVLPAITMFSLIESHTFNSFFSYSAFLLAIFSALRLANFNVDERQTESFIGLPVPANALFITGLVFLPSPFDQVTSSVALLIAITIIFSFLLVSPLELFALKFKNFGWADNKIRFTFILVSVLLLAFFKTGAIPLIILLYIAFSLGNQALSSRKN